MRKMLFKDEELDALIAIRDVLLEDENWDHDTIYELNKLDRSILLWLVELAVE